MTKYLLIILLFAATVAAGTLTVEYTASTTDMTSIRDAAGTTGWNWGAADPVMVGMNASASYSRIVIRFTQFDDTLDYLNATCDSGWLYLKVETEDVGKDATMDMHFCNLLSGNIDWDEGTLTGASAIDGATWTHADIGETETWAGSQGASTADTDYDATPDTTFEVDSAYFSSAAYYKFTITDETLEYWRDNNTGMLIWTDNWVTGGKNFEPNILFYSDDNATESNRPKLLLHYTLWPDCFVCGTDVDYPNVIHDNCYDSTVLWDSTLFASNSGRDTCYYPGCTDSSTHSIADTLVSNLVIQSCAAHHDDATEAWIGPISEESQQE